jgi:hypothetical protein
MFNKSVISALSFLLLFAWQIGIICSNGLLYGQVSIPSEANQSEIHFDDSSESTFIEIADDNSNSGIFVEEVLEEEIHPGETISLQLVRHLSNSAVFYYLLFPTNCNQTFLIPPERLV